MLSPSFMVCMQSALSPNANRTSTPPINKPGGSPRIQRFSSSPRGGAPLHENVLMQTDAQELLQALVDRGWVATVPPGQDDDLTILHVAMEDVRASPSCLRVLCFFHSNMCVCVGGGENGLQFSFPPSLSLS